MLNNGSAHPYSGPADIGEDGHDTFAVMVADVDKDGNFSQTIVRALGS